MNNKWTTGLIALIAAGVTYKAIQTVRYVRLQKELYEEVQEEATDEK